MLGQSIPDRHPPGQWDSKDDRVRAPTIDRQNCSRLFGAIQARRPKHTGAQFRVGVIEDEVSISDGEQKYFVQFVRLEPGISAEKDDTRHVLRIGYYTQRTD